MTSATPASARATDEPPAHATPDPKARARALLEDAQRLLEQALVQAKSASPSDTAATVGRASDRIGSALYFLRTVTRG